jgi:RND family efflux transporter MFP subunit
MRFDEQFAPGTTTEVEPPDSQSPRPTQPANRGRMAMAAVIVLAIVAAVVVRGILPRVKALQDARAETDQLAVPSVSVIQLLSSSAQQEIVLPANLQPFVDAPIYARTNGYLKRWYADIGARVKKGQLLAEIDTPEVDAQLRQARADLSTTQANLHLAEITAARYQELLKTNSIAKQEVDNAVGDLEAKQATLQSAQYNVKRLEDLESFQRIYAPFDGVVTARNTDVGQLIDSGSGGGPAKELFHVAAIETLRVYANVPQVYSPAARRGMEVDLTLPQFSGRHFHGTLVRTTDAIDPASRTLLVEIDVKNPTGELLPGAYAEAHFKLASAAHTYLLPVPALIFRSEGLQVATVNDGQHAVLKHIQVGRDFGTQVEVVAGLNDSDRVIVNPPDSLIDGEMVHPVAGSQSGEGQ